MTNAAKRRAILFLVLAAVIIVLLAAALPQLELQKGVLLPGRKAEMEIPGQGAEGEKQTDSSIIFMNTILGLFIVALLVFVWSRRMQMNRRQMLQVISVLAMTILIFAFILYGFTNITTELPPLEIIALPEVLPAAGPPLAPVPQGLLWLVWAILAGGVMLMVVGMARARFRRRARRDPLAVQAEEAVEALKAGQNFSNVIIRCYEQMSQVLKKERRLVLETTMTAREFEALLEKRGIPSDPVHQLTRLFEIARYAPQAPGPAEEAQAIECLNAIAQHSQKRAPREPQ